MDHVLRDKIAQEWNIPPETVEQYDDFYSAAITPNIKKRYLSHLVATVEDMVNEKRIKYILETIKAQRSDLGQLKNKLSSRTLRPYSIVLVPINLQRRATTRYHSFGTIIYYNSSYEENTARILIAHELCKIKINFIRKNVNGIYSKAMLLLMTKLLRYVLLKNKKSIFFAFFR
jgi:hypothetical protein